MNRIAAESRTQSDLLRQASVEERDILKIWSAMSRFIKNELSRRRGVVLPGLGTFTFVEKRLEIGNNKQIVEFRPFFVPSEKFAKMHTLEYEVELINASIPVCRINFAAISQLTKLQYSRETVELVIGEVFAIFDHFLRVQSSLNIPFDGVGTLKIFNQNPKPKRQVKFVFSM